MVLVPLKITLNFIFSYGVSALFTEAFAVWCDNSSSFYKLSYGWIWLFVGFCWVCFVERTVLGSGCLVGLCDGDPFLLQGIQV